MTDEEKQKAWIKKVVEMSFSEWMEYSKKFAKSNPKALREGARARLRARGLIEVGNAIGERWIEEEWFEKAKECGAIVWDEYNSQWIPGYYYAMDQDGNPTYDFRDYEAWLREYRDWKSQQPKKIHLEYTDDLADYAQELFKRE